MASFKVTSSKNKSFPLVKSKSTGGLMKEGILFKRQRGRRATDLRGLKFQERFCTLEFNVLKYYSRKKDVGHKPSGIYQVGKIKIVEEVPEGTFIKRQQYCFQIGDENEVMYFSAISKQDRDAWIETFRVLAFKLMKNEPLPFYHSGVYGHSDKNVWSCCMKEGRKAEGCMNSTRQTPSLERKLALKQEDSLPARGRTDSLRMHSMSLTEYTFYDHDSIGTASLSSSESDCDIDEFVDTIEGIPATFPNESLRISKQSLDSGISISTLNVGPKSPGPGVSLLKKQLWLERDKIPSSPTILEDTGSDTRHSSDHFVYTHKTTICLEEEGSSHVTTMFYRGADKLVTATNNGNICMSTVNSTESSKHTIFESKHNCAPVSVSIRRKYIAIGSEKIYIGKVDGTQVKNLKCLDVQNQVLGLPQLVAFASADSTFYSASKGGNLVSVWNTNKDSPTSTFKVGNDGDEIFSLTTSPKQSWLAVGVKSSEGPGNDFVYIFNCENKLSIHDSIEIGHNSGVRVAFTHNGEHLFISSDVKIQCINLRNKFTDFSHTFKQDCSITSLASSPVRHHLAVGLNTGEVKVFTSAPGHGNLVLSSVTSQNLEMQSNSAVTVLAYSRDGMKIAVTYQNGMVQIWKGSKPPEEPALINTGSVPLTSKGLDVDLPDDGCRIVIPEGAVKEGIRATLHYGVIPHSPYGPFEYEHKVRPVSTIISICPEPIDTEFLKPIEITVPHFIACRSRKDLDKLFFSKARHDNFRVEKSKKIYQFEKITDGEISHFCQYNLQSKIPQGAATLYTKHCCYICITEGISEEDTSSKKVFSLQQIVPRNRDYSGENLVYFSLSYHLKTCVKVVDEQFPDEFYEKCKKVVTFKDSHERILKIRFSSEQLPGGWDLQCTNSGQIAERDLCFWDEDIIEDIEQLCHNKHYPPKIPLHVMQGQEPVMKGISTKVSFTGVCGAYVYEKEDIQFLLELTKPVIPLIELTSPRRPPSFSSNTSHDSTSYMSSRTRSISSVQDLQEQFFDIANSVDCKRLASALFSESSTKKCSYLDESERKKVRNFIDRARGKCTDNFNTNYEILSDVMAIADDHSQYVSAIQAALNKLDPRSEPRSKKESISSTSAVSFATADENPFSTVPSAMFQESVMQSTPMGNRYPAPFSAESGPSLHEDN